jgi:hypothetical protein
MKKERVEDNIHKIVTKRRERGEEREKVRERGRERMGERAAI